MEIKQVKCRKITLREMAMLARKEFTQDLPDFFYADIKITNVRKREKWE